MDQGHLRQQKLDTRILPAKWVLYTVILKKKIEKAKSDWSEMIQSMLTTNIISFFADCISRTSEKPSCLTVLKAAFKCDAFNLST